MGNAGNWLRWLGGTVVLVLLLQHLGWFAIRDAVCAVGPWFAAIAVVDLLSVVCDAAAIASFARPTRVSLARALVAQASGFAVNQVTPGNALGEPVKVGILARDTPQSVAVSALVHYNVATLAVNAACIVVGLPIVLAALEVSTRTLVVASIASAGLVGVVVAITILMRHAACSRAIRALRRMRVIGESTAARWHDRAAPIDRELARFGARSMRRGFWFVLASRALHWAGTLVLLRAVGILDNVPLVVAILTLGIAIAWASSAMPLGLGISDGAHGSLYEAFGATSAAGLQFAMLDRARVCLVTALSIGLAAAMMTREVTPLRERRTAITTTACRAWRA